MHSNYMLSDLWGMIKAIAAFPLFVFVPGFVTGWLLNLLEFRRRRTLVQLLLSTPLSIALCPIVTFLLGRCDGYIAVWIAYSLFWGAFLVIGVINWREFRLVPADCAERWTWAGLALWMLFAIVSLSHIQLGDRLYYSNTAFDYCVRSAFTASVMRSIPPANPFFAAFEAVPLRYHYFWMMMCALPARMLRIPPVLAMYGGTVWIGIAFVSTIALYLRFILHEVDRIAQKALLGAGLLLVTGLDLLPTAWIFLRYGYLLPDPEWWNLQVSSWLDSLLWVPHYLAALVACLVAFLLITEAVRSERVHRFVAIALAGVAFASAVGLGVYVTLVFVVFAVLWVLVCVSRNWLQEAGLVVLSGVIAIAVASPYLFLMTPASDGGGGGGSQGSFAELVVRPLMPVAMSFVEHGYRDPLFLNFVNLLLLPLNYALELGFFLLVGILHFRKQRSRGKVLAREELACWALLISSLLIGSFVTSNTIGSNDLGMRSMLPAQFVLLLWAVPLLHSWLLNSNSDVLFRPTRILLGSTLVLGIAFSLYQATVLRSMWILLDTKSAFGEYFLRWPGLEVSRGVYGTRVLAMRQAFDAAHAELMPDAVVQANPDKPDYVAQLLFDDFPAASGQANCGIGFGGDEARCRPVYGSFARLFQNPQQQDGSYVDDVCRAFKTSALVVSDTDPVWSAGTWVWSRPSIFANDHVRVLPCGDFAPGNKNNNGRVQQ